MTNSNTNRRERKRNRLPNYDYSQIGCYFITICTQNREMFFGEIKNDKMVLNKYGDIIAKQWQWLAEQYNYVKLDAYIVMPNHLHGILIMDRSRPVPTINARPVLAEKIKSLSELIGAFKTTSSKIIHQNGLANFVWQRSFYDHIIRNEKSLNNIRAYIINNPLKWENDRNNILDTINY